MVAVVAPILLERGGQGGVAAVAAAPHQAAQNRQPRRRREPPIRPLDRLGGASAPWRFIDACRIGVGRFAAAVSWPPSRGRLV